MTTLIELKRELNTSEKQMSNRTKPIELNNSEKIKKIFLDSSPHRQPAE